MKDLAVLLENFQRRGVSLVSVAESLDTSSASGRLVLNIMVSVSQWEREAIGERTRDAMQHKRAKMEYLGMPLWVPAGRRQTPRRTGTDRANRAGENPAAPAMRSLSPPNCRRT